MGRVRSIYTIIMFHIKKKLSLIVQFEIIYHNKLKRILRKRVDKRKPDATFLRVFVSRYWPKVNCTAVLVKPSR